MIDVSTIQTFPIPKELLQIQEANTALTLHNEQLLFKAKNLTLIVVVMVVVGTLFYHKLKEEHDEQNYTFS